MCEGRGRCGAVMLRRESIGTTAQFVGSAGDAFSAICCLQNFRFTSSKPSKSAIASDEKFIRLRANSFVRYCLYLPPSASAEESPPSAKGGGGWRRSRHKLLFRAFQARPKDGARLAALRSPFGNLRPPSSCNWSVSNVGRSRRLCQPP